VVSHCANSSCQKPLHYLREGRIFLISRKRSSDSDSKLPYRLEHFWLCGTCSKEWTIAADGTDQIKLMEIKRRRSLRAGFAVPSTASAS
jgi:hypothetical protein